MNSMSLDNFASKLVDDIKEAVLYEVKEDARMALINAINKTVYVDKKTYAPTYNLLDAVEIRDLKIGTSRATFTVGINASRLIPIPNKPWNWDAHSDISGNPFQEGLVEVLDQGTGSRDDTVNKTPSKGESFYNHRANHFFEKAFDDIETNLIRSLASSLRAKGWTTTIY